MVHATNSTTSSRSLLFLTVAVTIAMLYFGRQIFIPLALALVLSFLLNPLVGLIEKGHLGRTPAVVMTLVICFALTVVAGWAITGQLLEITAHVPDYRINLQQKIQSLNTRRHGALSQATESVRELNKELTDPSKEPAANPGSSASRSNNAVHADRPIPVQVTTPPSNLVQDVSALLGPLAGPLRTVGIVIIFTAFMLIKREDLRNRLIRLGGQGQLSVMTQALDDASRRLSRYLLLQFLVNGLYGGLFGLGLYLIGIPHALLWGALGALLRLIPYVGTLIAAAFPVAVALAVFPGWTHALLSFGVFLALELTISNILEPWLYGAQTGISSLAILVAAVFWAMLWGPVGLILSTPLTVCLMLLGRYVPQLDFLEVLLGDEPVLKVEEHFYQRLLAMDQEEARNIAESHLQHHSVESLYESVVIPALRLAEEDRHRDALSDQICRSIFQNTRELIEDLSARFVLGESMGGNSSESENEDVDKRELLDPQFAAVKVACIPARDEADELVGMMLAHLLRQEGNGATYLAIGTVEDMLQQVAQGGFRIVCISALPPFALGQARSLGKRLQARFPELAIVIGLWEFAGGVPKAQERLGQACTDAVATNLTEALLQVRRLALLLPTKDEVRTPA